MHIPVHRRIGVVWKWEEQCVRIDHKKQKMIENESTAGVVFQVWKVSWLCPKLQNLWQHFIFYILYFNLYLFIFFLHLLLLRRTTTLTPCSFEKKIWNQAEKTCTRAEKLFFFSFFYNRFSMCCCGVIMMCLCVIGMNGPFHIFVRWQ